MFYGHYTYTRRRSRLTFDFFHLVVSWLRVCAKRGWDEWKNNFFPLKNLNVLNFLNPSVKTDEVSQFVCVKKLHSAPLLTNFSSWNRRYVSSNVLNPVVIRQITRKWWLYFRLYEKTQKVQYNKRIEQKAINIKWTFCVKSFLNANFPVLFCQISGVYVYNSDGIQTWTVNIYCVWGNLMRWFGYAKLCNYNTESEVQYFSVKNE